MFLTYVLFNFYGFEECIDASLYMRVSAFFLVFSFLYLQLIYRQTLEFKVRLFSLQSKKIKIKTEKCVERHIFLFFFWHVAGNFLVFFGLTDNDLGYAMKVQVVVIDVIIVITRN